MKKICEICGEVCSGPISLMKHRRVAHRPSASAAAAAATAASAEIAAARATAAAAAAVKAPPAKASSPSPTLLCDECGVVVEGFPGLAEHQLAFHSSGKTGELDATRLNTNSKKRTLPHSPLHTPKRQKRSKIPIRISSRPQHNPLSKIPTPSPSKMYFNHPTYGNPIASTSSRKSPILNHSACDIGEKGMVADPSRPSAENKCLKCDKMFACRRELNRHSREQHGSKVFECNICGNGYAHARNLKRHVNEKHDGKHQFTCSQCKGTFSRKFDLANHRRYKRCGTTASAIRQRLPRCKICRQVFQNIIELLKHKQKKHKQTKSFKCHHGCERVFKNKATLANHSFICSKFRTRKNVIKTWFSKRAAYLSELGSKDTPSVDSPSEGGSTYQATGDEIPALDGGESVGVVQTERHIEGHLVKHSFAVSRGDDLHMTLIRARSQILELLTQDILNLHSLKWYIVAAVNVKLPNEEVGDSNMRHPRCEVITTLTQEYLAEDVGKGVMGVLNHFDKLCDGGSQMIFGYVHRLYIHVARYAPTSASSYIPLPEPFDHPRKGLINIQNDSDNKCFLYSVLAGIKTPATNANRVRSYLHRLNELDMTGISYPVKLTDIDKFERQNKTVSIAVLGIGDNSQVVPMRVRKGPKRFYHVNLFHISDEDGNTHYCLIKDMSALLGHAKTSKRRLFWCENCLNAQDTLARHLAHRERCIQNDAQAVRMPTPGKNIMKFREFDKQTWHDYAVYADFESVLLPVEGPLPDPTKSHTTKLESHVAFGWSYCIVGPNDELHKGPIVYHRDSEEGPIDNDGVAKKFLLELKKEQAEINVLRGPDYPLNMTEASQKRFEKATACYLCGDTFKDNPALVKVRDHNHKVQLDNFIGAACSLCNLNRKTKAFLPVLIHNASAYDNHLLFSAIGELSNGRDLYVIPKTKEKYISFQWGGLRFLDSYAFLQGSLQTLVNNLKSEDLKITKAVFPDDELRGLVCRKGVYPYNYLNSYERFEETCLPPKDCFFNTLTNSHITDEDYQHAKNVWDKFQMKTNYDYHDLYVKTDCILLADCFQSFRHLSMNYYKVDSIHYYTTPNMAWSAALRVTGQKLELLTDLDMHLMWEKSMRGGVATISERLVYANNPYVPESYDESKDRQYIAYLDANNLYGQAMSLPLPVGNFQWLTDEEIKKFDLSIVKTDESKGFLIEADIAYPKSLHDSHNDFPLCPEHVAPQYDELSNLQKELIELYNLPKQSKLKKLIPNLKDKEKYVLSGTTLQLYVDLGLQIKKIHRIISYDQSRWLEPFISFNTNKRAEAKDKFTQDFLKLTNNSCYGKSSEATRGHKNVSFTKEAKMLRKWVALPTFHSFDIFDHGLVVVEKRKALVTLNRPIFCGSVILDRSKEVMYSFFYEVLKKRYGENVRLLGTDTDSLMLAIQTEDLYDDMKEMEEWFDTSAYPTDHKCFSLQNRKKLGKFKDEMNSVPIVVFCGLKAKMYSFKTVDGYMKAVGKGIPRRSLKEEITHEDYEDTVINHTMKYVSFKKIGTDRHHHLYTLSGVRRGLTAYDDKRIFIEGSHRTFAFGHYKVNKTEEDCDNPERNIEELIELMDIDNSL